MDAAALLRRLSSLLPALPVLALAALSIGTAAQVGCTQSQEDDATREDPPDAGDATPATEADCKPAAHISERKTPDSTTSCKELCQSKGLKCNDQGYASWRPKPIPVFPYAEPASCHYAGVRVSFACETCYSGSEFESCDGELRWSTRNSKSGPYEGTFCACSPE